MTVSHFLGEARPAVMSSSLELKVILHQGETADHKRMQSHLLQAIGQLFWPSDSHSRHSCSRQSLICCVSTWWIFNAIEQLTLQVRAMIMKIPLLSNLQHSGPVDHAWLCFLPSTFCVEIRAPFYYFLSQWQYHTFWERLGQLWCLESRAQGHPVIRNHGETICYRQLASCFGRVTAVGDIHVSATRNVADPQSRGNHWCEAIALPCAIENWPSVLAEWQPWETFM